MNEYTTHEHCLSGFSIQARGENLKQGNPAPFQTFNCRTTFSGISITGKNSWRLYFILNLSISVYTLFQTPSFMVLVPKAGWGKLPRGQKERLFYWDIASLGCSSNLLGQYRTEMQTDTSLCSFSGHSLCRAADQPPSSTPKSHIQTVVDARTVFHGFPVLLYTMANRQRW